MPCGGLWGGLGFLVIWVFSFQSGRQTSELLDTGFWNLCRDMLVFYTSESGLKLSPKARDLGKVTIGSNLWQSPPLVQTWVMSVPEGCGQCCTGISSLVITLRHTQFSLWDKYLLHYWTMWEKTDSVMQFIKTKCPQDASVHCGGEVVNLLLQISPSHLSGSVPLTVS